MNVFKLIYWIATGIMCLIFLFSAVMYFANYQFAHDVFAHLGFPTWMVYPSAILKILGVVAVLSKKSSVLKEWAYAGFFFDAALAFSSHIIVDGTGWMIAAIALTATVVSRVMEEQLFGRK